MTTQQQDFQAIAGNWETPADWVNGIVPTSVEDAAIGAHGNSGALLNNNVTVNSIAVNRGSALTITDDTLIATNGTVTSPADTDVLVSGNLGIINVQDDGILEFDGNFNNQGTLNVRGNLVVNGDVDILGSGTVNLENSVAFNGDLTFSGNGLINFGENFDQGLILGQNFSGGVTNADDTLSGLGQIDGASFNNQSGGTVNAGAAFASGELLDFLGIDASTISNEGAINVVANAGFFLNAQAGNISLVNTGHIDFASQSDLGVGADLTISGAGVIALDGAGVWIGSQSLDDAYTLTNKSTIEGLSSQAELGQDGANERFLTLVNEGAIIADLRGDELTVSTGSNVIRDAGGLFESENAAQLTIDSAVQTGQFVPPGSAPPKRSTIEAASGGVVDIDAAISDGVTFANQLNGQIVIDGGTVTVAAGVSLGVPVTFAGAGGTLNLGTTPVAVVVNGGGGAINLSNAQAEVTGGGFTITDTGVDALTVGGNREGGGVDVVHASGETTTLLAESFVTFAGNHDKIDAGANDELTMQGANDLLNLQKSFGSMIVRDFGASDVIAIAKSDFADFQLLLGHTTQSGANTLITLDAHDTIELTNVKVSSLTAAEFHFV